jgi:6-pyruvoyltetrahydropterin/6-carboxytetrahydropterin synthase
MTGGGLTDDEARARFGNLTCDHEHLYRVDVTVGGDPDPGTGLLIDLVELDAMIEREITGRLTGSSINDVVSADNGKLPGCETVAEWIWNRLAPAVAGGARLVSVRVAEDDFLAAEYRGN